MIKSPAANAGIWVQSLVQEDSTCCKSSKPQLSSCTTATEPERPRATATEPERPRATATEPERPRARALQQEVTAVRSQHHN